MSSEVVQTPAEVLISSAVKTIGKRDFLKTVEKMFCISKIPTKTTNRTRKEISAELQCLARVKGERTGIKVGRNVLFEAQRCPRSEVDSGTHLCAIHTNQKEKKSSLPLGLYVDPLTEEQRCIFGDL